MWRSRLYWIQSSAEQHDLVAYINSKPSYYKEWLTQHNSARVIMTGGDWPLACGTMTSYEIPQQHTRKQYRAETRRNKIPDATIMCGCRFSFVMQVSFWYLMAMQVGYSESDQLRRALFVETKLLFWLIKVFWCKTSCDSCCVRESVFFQLCCCHVSIFNFTDLLCVSVVACLPGPNQLAAINLKDFFLFHCKRAWLICQCLTQSRVNTYSTQPCQHCLWPSGEIINQPKSLPSFLLSPLSHHTFLRRFSFSHSSIFSKHHLSLTLSFCCLATHSPFSFPTLSCRHTQRHTKDTHIHAVHFDETTSYIPLPRHHSP